VRNSISAMRIIWFGVPRDYGKAVKWYAHAAEEVELARKTILE